MFELLGTGLWLTVFGMGLVFLLLAALWGLVRVLLWFDRGEEPEAAREEVVLAATETPAALAVRPSEVEPDLLAAITIAVLMHRAIRRRQAAPLMRKRLPSTEASRWVAAGRTRQNGNWNPSRR